MGGGPSLLTKDLEIADLKAEIRTLKRFDRIKASYPEDKHGEIREILKKVELKTATAEDVLKLSTAVWKERILRRV